MGDYHFYFGEARRDDVTPSGNREEQGVPVFRRVRLSNGTRTHDSTKKLTRVKYQPQKMGNAVNLFESGLDVGYGTLRADLDDLSAKAAWVSDHTEYQANGGNADLFPTRVLLSLRVEVYNDPKKYTDFANIPIKMPGEVPSPTRYISSLDIDFMLVNSTQAVLVCDFVYGDDTVELGKGEQRIYLALP